MLEARQAPQAYFRTLLQTVMGQALAAAGYQLEPRPLQWAGGRYRFVKALDDGARGIIEFQVLVYSDTLWSSGMASRFKVRLIRAGAAAGALRQQRTETARGLSHLVVEDFGVNILPEADHWWSFRDTDSLGKALAEAGHLLVGYGLPWLAGELEPPER